MINWWPNAKSSLAQKPAVLEWGFPARNKAPKHDFPGNSPKIDPTAFRAFYDPSIGNAANRFIGTA